MRKLLSPISVGVLAVGVILGAQGTLAMGSGSSDSGSAGSAQQKSTYAQAVEKVKARDFSGAIPMLRQVVAAEPSNADAFNYLGYSHREIGDFKSAMTAYKRALAIDPNHKGANEYLGELYVKLGDLPKAQAQLAVLDRLCQFGCAEYEELKRKVAALRKRRGS